MDCADCREDFLCKLSGPRVDWEQFVLIFGVDANRDGGDDDNGGDDANGYQSELPLYGEGDNESRHKGRHALNRERQLFRDTVVDIVPVASSLRCDGSRFV